MVLYSREKSRYHLQKSTSKTTIKNDAGIVHKIIVTSSNGATSSGSVILYDDTTEVLNIPAGAQMPLVGELDVYCGTSIAIQNSNANENTLITYT